MSIYEDIRNALEDARRELGTATHPTGLAGAAALHTRATAARVAIDTVIALTEPAAVEVAGRPDPEGEIVDCDFADGPPLDDDYSEPVPLDRYPIISWDISTSNWVPCADKGAPGGIGPRMGALKQAYDRIPPCDSRDATQIGECPQEVIDAAGAWEGRPPAVAFGYRDDRRRWSVQLFAPGAALRVVIASDRIAEPTTDAQRHAILRACVGDGRWVDGDFQWGDGGLLWKDDSGWNADTGPHMYSATFLAAVRWLMSRRGSE